MPNDAVYDSVPTGPDFPLTSISSNTRAISSDGQLNQTACIRGRESIPATVEINSRTARARAIMNSDLLLLAERGDV